MSQKFDVVGYLRGKEQSASPAMALKWAALEDRYSKRLWHQLTVELMEFVPELQGKRILIELYENFIKEFEKRMNKLSYMELCALVVQEYDNLEEAYSFLDNCELVIKALPKPDFVALALCRITRGQIKLEKEQDLPAVKEILEDVDQIFKGIDGITVAHGRFYELQSKFYFIQNNLTEYYRSAIKFLGCTPLEKLPLDQQRIYARNLAISSLVADGMYNFGELLAHPILNSLRRTTDEWLLHLVKAFNTGDMTEFEALRKKWVANNFLAENEKKLRTKVILLAIMETAFERAANERQLSFKQISNVTRLPIDEVEMYVMKAFAQGLIKGKTDGVAGKVYITWVQPRVLAPEQIRTMITQLDGWQKDLNVAEDMMKRNTVEILED